MNRISIIIPAYNVEKYLRNCMDSVINQSYPEIEAIVVDDGSTDKTGLIADEYAKNDKRVKVVHKNNEGPSSARNIGMMRASGEYVMFLDSDDWIELECCNILEKEISKEKSDIVFFEYYKEFSNRTVRVKTYEDPKLTHLDGDQNSFFIYDMRTITAWGKLYSKQILDEIFFDEKMRKAEDVDFNFRIYSRVKKATYLNKPLLHYRILMKSEIHGYDALIKEKIEYPIYKLRKWKQDDEIKHYAYYSFAAIAYILICQNGIYLNSEITKKQKLKEIKALNKNDWVKDLFSNVDKVKIPKSRKTLIYMGKYSLNLFIFLIIAIKEGIEKKE